MTWFVDKLGPRTTDVTAQNTGRAASLSAKAAQTAPAAGKATPPSKQAPPQASGGDDKKKKKGWF